ncbi:ATP-dependent DNA helicase II subunit 1 [Yamadazyma tenuis]|uniref:DNA helicase n=1 Tax=Candida tenuis (strain ATCC 10573 / BCRC 21748 / CBS 615 / JCM 9827 / NBRC 10315 / NRRL Y-1498 / VKM Y-70) TaxID=590646 RepID=G3B8F4_CANTC|nr:uncharacterized protein CANTEDRAFT_126248 [Yamadazyma tenuis ATCC 10573]EGV62386.1 hypothetical protein CANTEDRAFT_126248 [Yamadazyma tenuis ATCC 10573]WEJ93651.1 ATP-dependent DNA helicase II subunit 1 [Yamadazyma tenuis]
MSSYAFEDDDEYGTDRQYAIRDGIIFLVELNDEIFRPLKSLGGKSQILQILWSINRLLQESVIMAPSTGVGVFFYNCSKSHSGFPKESRVDRLFRLHELNLKDMRRLNFLIEDELSGLKPIRDSFSPSSDPVVDLNEVFNVVYEEFKTQSTKSFNRKKLIWFTNNHNPYNLTQLEGNEELLSKLRETTANYFAEMIPIVPMFLKLDTNDTFDLKFFESVFSNTNFLTLKNKLFDSNNGDNTVVVDKIGSIISRIKQVRRIQIGCNLILSDGKIGGKFGCSVKGYTLYNHEQMKKVSHIYADAEDLTVVQSEATIKTKDDHEVVKIPDDPNTTYEERKSKAGGRKGFSLKYKNEDATMEDVFYLDNKQVEFLKQYTFDHSPEDDTKVESESEDDLKHEDEDVPYVALSHPPYLKLLGFRHVSKFKPYYNMAAPIFITFDSSNGYSLPLGFQNSKDTFTNLYKSCVKLERYAMLFGCTKKNALPSLFALYPTNIAKSSNQDSLPEGFLLVRLPWLDDIRALPPHMIKNPLIQFDKSKSSLPTALVDSFKVLMKKLHIQNYNPGDFPNPSLNFFYEVLKNDLLQIESSDAHMSIEKFDATFQYLENISTILSKGDLKRVVESINKDLDASGVLLIDEDPMEPPTKKPKPTVEVDDSDILTAWKSNSLNQFNMNQLKSFVSRYKNSIKSATKKQDLINNIVDFLESRNAAT